LYTEADIYAEMTDSTRGTACNTSKHPIANLGPDDDLNDYSTKAFQQIEEASNG
jgi:hypothetical protein